MSLKLVPPREGRSRHWRIRGTIKGQYIDESTGVSSQTRAEEIRIKRENELLYRVPVIPRCGRVDRQVYHVWGMGDAGLLLSQRTGGGRAAAVGTTRERACLPAGSDDRKHARGDGA